MVALFLKKVLVWDFPGGLVVKTPPSNAGGLDLIPGCDTVSTVPHLFPMK